MKFTVLIAAIVVCFAQPLYAKKCVDRKKVYKVCSNQERSFKQSIYRAKKKNKLILVKFGAEWCPWCQSLHKIFHSKDFKGKYHKKFELLEVGVFHYDSKTMVDSGMHILQRLLDKNNLSKDKVEGYPFIAVVNPKTLKAIFINTGKLEDNRKGKGHYKQKVYQALKIAASKV